MRTTILATLLTFAVTAVTAVPGRDSSAYDFPSSCTACTEWKVVGQACSDNPDGEECKGPAPRFCADDSAIPTECIECAIKADVAPSESGYRSQLDAWKQTCSQPWAQEAAAASASQSASSGPSEGATTSESTEPTASASAAPEDQASNNEEGNSSDGQSAPAPTDSKQAPDSGKNEPSSAPAGPPAEGANTAAPKTSANAAGAGASASKPTADASSSASTTAKPNNGAGRDFLHGGLAVAAVLAAALV